MSDEIERELAECTCTGLPQPEGPCAWCDVHGQPSAAWSQGIENGVQQERVLSEMRQSDLRWAIRDILEFTPKACKYHGQDFEVAGMWRGRPRCELCRLPWAAAQLRAATEADR